MQFCCTFVFKELITIANFGERFKQLRIERKHTQSSIGEELGLKLRMIQYYENNQSFPDFKRLIRIADYFDVSLDYLVGRSDDPKRY